MKVCEGIWLLSAAVVKTWAQTCAPPRLECACLTVPTMDLMCAQEICMFACLSPSPVYFFVLRPLCDEPGGGNASSGRHLICRLQCHTDRIKKRETVSKFWYKIKVQFSGRDWGAGRGKNDSAFWYPFDEASKEQNKTQTIEEKSEVTSMQNTVRNISSTVSKVQSAVVNDQSSLFFSPL